MKLIRRTLLVIIFIVLVVIAVFVLNGYREYQNIISQESLTDKVTRLQKDKDYVTINDVPKYYKNAVIAIEDRRFYDHGALDIFGIARAIVANFRAKEMLEGGSTITQQVAKNLYFNTEDMSSTRKIAEFFVAYDLEKKYQKDSIFELYMNIIYFGDGYYGIHEACSGYFDKEPNQMDLYEATMLAGIPNAPSVYAPTVNPDLAKSRQRKVINDMVTNGYLSQEEANKVLDEQKVR